MKSTFLLNYFLLLFFISITKEYNSYSESFNEEENINYSLYRNEPIKNKNIYEININKDNQFIQFNESSDILIDAKISEKEGNEKDKYYFIIMNIQDGNYFEKKRGADKIYASTNESFLQSNDVLRDYEFKSYDSYRLSIITIPYEKVSDKRKLYIRIQCEGNYPALLGYRIRNSRGMEGIDIFNRNCYEISLQKLDIYDADKPYRFVYQILDKENYILISITSSTVNNFTAFTTGLEADYLKKNFHNGYSFLFEYTEGYYEYHTFLLYPDKPGTFRICHRVVNNNEIKTISLGEEVYSTMRNHYLGLNDCFQLLIDEKEMEEYDYYVLNYITKTKNVKIKYNSDDKEVEEELYYDSGNIYLNYDTISFCLFFEKEKEESSSKEEYSGVYFQVIGVKTNNIITQELNGPLINGLPTYGSLFDGQMLYYRLFNYLEGSKFIDVNILSIFGDIKLYKSLCEKPDCYFSKDDIGNGNLIDITNYIYDNNHIHFKEGIEGDKYPNEFFPVYVTYCEDECYYRIEMNNENNLIQLNENELFYNKIETNEEEGALYFTDYIIIKPRDTSKYEVFVEVYTISGKITDVYINDKKGEGIFSCDNKVFIFKSYAFDMKGYTEHNTTVAGKNGSLFYIHYYHLIGRTPIYEQFYHLTEERMYYNVLVPDTNSRQTLNYLIDEEEKYIISLWGINSYLAHSLDTYKSIEQYHQIMTERTQFRVYCSVGEGNGQSGACEYIISIAKLSNNGVITKIVKFDAIYQFYIINDETGVKKINLLYYLSDEELEKLKSDKIVVTVNKNSLDDLTIQYGYNSERTTGIITLHGYSGMFQIDLKNLINNIYKLEDGKNYLFITISSDRTIEFKIRTNVKNLPIHLDTDAVEFGYLNNNDSFIYYFDYVYKDKEIINLEELYLYNKGNVKVKIVILKFKGIYANNAYNMTNIDFDNPSISYIDNNSGKNHIRINGKEYNYTEGCRFVLKVYLDNNETNKNNKEMFYIYRHVQNENKRLLVELNTNVYGNFYYGEEEYYFFYIKLNNLKGNLIINLNCENCDMCIYNRPDLEYCDIEAMKSTIIYNDDNILQNTYLYCYITNGEGHYQLSFSDSSLPKYIEELHPEMCFNSCKFVFPLRNYYNYIKNIGNDTIIILHSPDDENIHIYYELVDIDKLNTELDDFDLTKNENKNYGNGLFIKLNTSEIKEKEKILRIHVISAININFNFIMNKIIYSENTEDIIYSKKIIYMDKESQEIKNDIISLENDIYYKIDLNLICGKGRVIIDNENQYQLDYEYQPSISLIIKTSNYSISSLNLDKDNNFTFFINATKLKNLNNLQEFTEILDAPKTHKILYYIDKTNNNSDIFPLKFKLQREKDKTVYINYRFIEIESKETNKTEKEIYELKNYEFYLNYSNNEDITNFQSIYYTELQRGFASMQFNNSKSNFVDIIINKNESLNNNTYKKLYLEITPIYINYKSKEIEKIYIPRNVYIQIDLNKTLDFYFIKSNYECNINKIDIGNATDINIDNPDKFENETKNGKYIYTINDNTKSEYNIKINPITNGPLIIKYTSKKNSLPNFDIYNGDITYKWEDKTKNLFTLIYQNIDTTTNNKEAKKGPNYKISYIIRIYDYLNFYENYEVETIMIKQNALKVFRKDLPDSEFNETEMNYNIDFGNLERKQYYINVLASASYNNSVEYFSYKQKNFRISQVDTLDFDQSWLAPLTIVLILFACFTAFMVYKIIKEIKTRKEIIDKKVDNILNENNKEDRNKVDSNDAINN